MTSHRSGPRAMFALVAVLATMAFGVGSASAAQELAKWEQSTTAIRWETTGIGLKAGTQLSSCTAITANGFAKPGESTFTISNGTFPYFGVNVPALKFSCTGGTELWIKLDGVYAGEYRPYAYYDTVKKAYFVQGVFESGALLQSPFGNYIQVPFTAQFTNNAKPGSSWIKFGETVIGETSYGPLKVTGGVTVTDGAGNARTLTH